MRIKEFINGVKKIGYGPALFFGEIGLDCGETEIENMPLTIVINPYGYLGGMRIIGKGTWNTLINNIDNLIHCTPLILRLESNPPTNTEGWYIFGDNSNKEKVLSSKKWVLIES